ncbi:hypothetical protein ACKTEK_13775 [Tepidamorphus sp. 3E244]|uniref:hypothetical protein n=1 Tax=Tepidamorphus sp. 3E244 TaxID=3385498 RepID=UPI0038FC9492
MKRFALLPATLISAAASSQALAHDVHALPHAHPHPDWTLALGAVAIIGLVGGVVFLACRAAAKAKDQGR